MSSKQPLPGNTPIPDEKPDNGDWSARALEAVRTAIECQDVPKDSRCSAQSSSDEHESSTSPHPVCTGIEREEPLAACARRLTAPPGDRLSFLATAPSAPGWRWVPFMASVAAAFVLGWTAGAGYYGHVNLKPVSVSSPPIFTTSAFVPDPRIARGSGPYSISSKSHQSARGRRTISIGDVREMATPAPQLPAQTTASIRDTSEPLIQVTPKRTPTPDTRPTTIDGWTIREVRGSTAVLEGPDGIRNVAVGDTIPGVGRIDFIVRWGNRWIVATSSGLVTTP